MSHETQAMGNSWHTQREVKEILFNIRNLVMLMMGCVYYKNATGDAKNTVPVYIDTIVKATGQIGTLIGQIVFGILADKYGRKGMYGIELMIIIVMTFASCFSANTVSGLSVFFILGMWRVFLGFGIGGDYPLSGKSASSIFENKPVFNFLK